MGLLDLVGDLIVGVGEIIDDVAGSVTNNSNQQTDYQERWDKLTDDLCQSLDNGEFEKAESMLGNHYSRFESEKDYWYYWFRSCIYVRWMESEPYELDENRLRKLPNKAKSSLQHARKMASDQDQMDNVDDMLARYEEAKIFIEEYFKWGDFWETYNSLTDAGNYEEAETVLDDQYSSISYDSTYYSNKLRCRLAKYRLFVYPSPEEASIRQEMNSLLAEYEKTITTDEEKRTFSLAKACIQREEVDNDLIKCFEEQDYKKGYDLVELYKVNNPDFEEKYLDLKVFVLVSEWKDTPVKSPSYNKLESAVLENQKLWEQACVYDGEKEYYQYFVESTISPIQNSKNEEKKSVQTSQTCTQNDETIKVTKNDSPEDLYRQEVLFCMEDGEIGKAERKLLERKRKSFGLSEEQARIIEASLTTEMTDEEQEYISIYKDLVEDGVPTGKLRRMLDREAEALGLTSEQVAKIEATLRMNSQ